MKSETHCVIKISVLSVLNEIPYIFCVRNDFKKSNCVGISALNGAKVMIGLVRV